MAAAQENIPDKARFDVYSMLVILTFVFTLGATLMLNDYLDKVWGFWAKPEERGPRAVHLTQMNSDDPASNMVKVSELDLQEWALATQHETGSEGTFTVSNFEWPKGYEPNSNNPLKPGVISDKGVLNPPFDILMKDYKGTPSASAPVAPAEGAPTAPTAVKEAAPAANP